jgi:hypothetical protein
MRAFTCNYLAEYNFTKKVSPEMLSFSGNSVGALLAVLLIAWGSMGFGLQDAPVDPLKAQANREQEIYAHARTVVDMTVSELRRDFSKECHDLAFADNQAELSQLLREVGENVEALIRDIPDTTSKEQIHRERLSVRATVRATFDSISNQHEKNSVPDYAADQKYNYLVLPSKTGLWEEIRTDTKGSPLPERTVTDSFMITSGFAGLSIFFHPQHQQDCRFRLLGRQTADSKAYLIAFAQKPETRLAMSTFASPTTLTPALIMYQGLAWVDPENHQILRIRTDLLAPRKDVQLAKQTTEVWYQEVHFRDIPHAFWLPREVQVTIEWSDMTYRNRHRYSEYMVFSVESRDKLEQLKVKK